MTLLMHFAFLFSFSFFFLCEGQLLAQVAYVKAPNSAAGNRFGMITKMSGDGLTLVVAAPWESSSAVGIFNVAQSQGGATNAGAVYVFVRPTVTGAWVFHSYIKASNTAANNFFGSCLALASNGKTLVVGAPGETSASSGINGDQAQGILPGAGASYLFVLGADNQWTQHSYFKSSTPGSPWNFGLTCDMSGDGATVVISEPSNSLPCKLHIFRLMNSTWSSTFLQPINQGRFALAHAISGDGNTIVASSGDTWGYASDILVYRWNSTQFTLRTTMPGRGTVQDCCGGAWGTGPMRPVLSFDGSVLALLNVFDGNLAVGINPTAITANGAPGSGSVTIYSFNGVALKKLHYIKPAVCYPQQFFGGSGALSFDGTMLVVGSQGDRSPSTGVNADPAPVISGSDSTGAIWIYRNKNGSWVQEEYLKTLVHVPGQQFGGGILGGWSGYLNTGGNAYQLGHDVSLSADGRFLAVGAPFEGGNATSINGLQVQTKSQSGCVYTFFDGCASQTGIAAGPNQVVCSTSTVQLNASLGSGTSGTWNGFSPGTVSSTSSPTAVFTPHVSQIGRDILLTWSVGSCSRSTTISIAHAPTVSATAFANSIVCVSSTIQVTSAFGGSATGGSWSGYAPGSLSPSFPFTVFTPHPSQSGSTVFLTWQSANPPACPPATAVVNITIFPGATVFAGDAIDACSDTISSIQLHAIMNGTATAGIWEGYAPGTISNPTDLNALFTPVQSQVGTVVKLTFKNTASGSCSLAVPSIVSVNVRAPPCSSPEPLSKAAITGIAVGATIGGLILIAVAIFATVKLYRLWNRNLVKFRSNTGVAMTSNYNF